MSTPSHCAGIDTLYAAPMSLKAKIEAVIYASEEPVTLAQLVGLLGEEGQAELDAQRSQQTSLALDDAAEPEPDDLDELNGEFLAAEPDAAVEPDAPTSEPEISEAAPAEADAPASEPEIAEAAPAGVSVVEDEKKLAREAAQEIKAREKALRDHFRSLLEQLMADYGSEDRGIEVREVAGGYRLATKPEYHDAVRGFVKSLKPPLKLSLQALETLAVVAYKQPVTAPEISEIRGVDSGGVLGGLMARKLVTTAGRKQVIGRPILYKTTKDFLVRFGLKDINELPSIEEFEKMAGELADTDPVQEEIQMEHPEEKADGESSSMDELNSAPEPTTILHDTPEEIEADKSVKPEGHEHEHADPHEVEPMADVHEPQSDGDSTPTDVEEESGAE
jgi:segregation and condensation protein B